MLNRDSLIQIKRAARREDWSVVGAIYLDLSLEASVDKFRVDSLAPFVRLRDPSRLIQIVDEALDDQSSEET